MPQPSSSRSSPSLRRRNTFQRYGEDGSGPGRRGPETNAPTKPPDSRFQLPHAVSNATSATTSANSNTNKRVCSRSRSVDIPATATASPIYRARARWPPIKLGSCAVAHEPRD
ncbi:MAG: hypothetical protein ACK5Z4_00635, partial [Planctomyces sp.]